MCSPCSVRTTHMMYSEKGLTSIVLLCDALQGSSGINRQVSLCDGLLFATVFL